MISTLKIAHKLIRGKYSYNSYYEIWQKLLRYEGTNEGITSNLEKDITLPVSIVRTKPIIQETENNNK